MSSEQRSPKAGVPPPHDSEASHAGSTAPTGSSVRHLCVAVFESEDRARDFFVDTAESHARGHLFIEDVCLVVRDSGGKVHVHESGDISTGKATLYGGSWGLFAGAVLGFPLAIAAAGAAAAHFAAKRRDSGISDAFEQAVAERLQPGTSAVVVLAGREQVAKVEAAAEHLGAWTRTSEIRP